MKRTYEVTAKTVTYSTIEVQAHSESEALLKASKIDGGDFTPIEDDGDWIIDSAKVVNNNFQLVKTEVDIDIEDKEMIFNVYWSPTDGVFTCICVSDPTLVVRYELETDVDTIIANHEGAILDYCLATVSKDDRATIGDLFLWDGGYLQRIA